MRLEERRSRYKDKGKEQNVDDLPSATVIRDNRKTNQEIERDPMSSLVSLVSRERDRKSG